MANGNQTVTVIEPFSAARFFGGGGGRILLCALAMVCVTYLISIKAFTSNYHMAGVLIGFGLLSGAVAGKEIIRAMEIVQQILKGSDGEKNENNSTPGKE